MFFKINLLNTALEWQVFIDIYLNLYLYQTRIQVWVIQQESNSMVSESSTFIITHTLIYSNDKTVCVEE